MCNVCERNMASIRRAIIAGEKPGTISLGRFEVGCWACDGQGNPSDQPFSVEAAVPAWNVYCICRTVEESNHPIKAQSEMPNRVLQFAGTATFRWDAALNTRWCYSRPDFWHRAHSISVVPNRPGDEENAQATFRSSKHLKALNFKIRVT